jgi:hypothetical protein
VKAANRGVYFVDEFFSTVFQNLNPNGSAAVSHFIETADFSRGTGMNDLTSFPVSAS